MCWLDPTYSQHAVRFSVGIEMTQSNTVYRVASSAILASAPLIVVVDVGKDKGQIRGSAICGYAKHRRLQRFTTL